MAVDTLGHLLALHVTSASAEGCGEVGRLARTVQAITNDAVKLAWVDQGYTGERAANAAARYGIALKVVKLPEAKTWLRLLAATLGGRAVTCMGDQLQASRQKLQTLCRNPRRTSHRRVRMPHDEAGRHARCMFITASRRVYQA